MTTSAEQHEEATARAFIQKNKQERCVAMLSNPKQRRKFTDELAHFKWLDERFTHTIPSGTAHTVDEWAALLRSKGAPQTVWVISEDARIDGQEMELREALSYIRGAGMGTILSCLPGRLAYFEDEDARYVLER